MTLIAAVAFGTLRILAQGTPQKPLRSVCSADEPDIVYN